MNKSSNQPIPKLPPVVRRFVEDAGNLTQSLGLGRVIGQLFAYLYFSRTPKNLADMQGALGISKGSASTAVRQLEQWAAVRKVWVKGDRKDYYEASDWFGRILKNSLADIMGKKMAAYATLLEDIEAEMDQIEDGDTYGKFVRERMENLRKFGSKATNAWTTRFIRKLIE